MNNNQNLTTSTNDITSIYESATSLSTPSSSSSSSPLEETVNIIRPPSVLYRYHKTPIQVSSNSYSVYDFPLGSYNPSTLQRTETDYYYIENTNKGSKKRKGGLFGSLRRKKNNKKNINTNVSLSNRNSSVYSNDDEIRRNSV